MTWINMLNGWQWAVLASLPPLLIALYFLKLRRTPVDVPSTYLWRKTIEDLHVNSIWQRLRQNLLLLLQLLTIAAIILSVLRPGIRGDQSIGSRSIFLIDQSASMAATDLGEARLQHAKRKAVDLVAGMDSDDVAMVVAFSDHADVIQGNTSDKRRLREAIESIQLTNRPTNISDALNTVAGLAGPVAFPTDASDDSTTGDETSIRSGAPTAVYLLSDGKFEAPDGDYANLAIEYISVGFPEIENIGIIAFTCERNADKSNQVEAFARLQNFGGTDARVNVSLSLNDSLVDASTVSIPAGETRGVSFEITTPGEGHLQLKLDSNDQFSVDNTAYAALTPPRQLEVVVATGGNAALLAALQTPQSISAANVRVISPSELESDSGKQLASSGAIDLFIYDGCAPTTMPEANTLFVGSMPPGDAWTASALSTDPLFVVDVHRTHPLMQYVELGSLLVVEGLGLNLPPGGTELVRTEAGTLMGVAPRGPYQDCVIGMSLRGNNTNWPRHRSFPVFLLNALEILGGASSATGARSFRPGQPAIMNVANRYDSVFVNTPSGQQLPLARDGQPQLIFTHTDDLGAYSVKEPDQDRIIQTFTVNLFSDQESSIAAVPEIHIGTQAIQSTLDQSQVVRIEYWRWLLIAALITLCVEWYLYIKRIAV